MDNAEKLGYTTQRKQKHNIMLLYLLELSNPKHMLAEHIIQVMADRNQNNVLFL
jgi:hypothetical protein